MTDILIKDFRGLLKLLDLLAVIFSEFSEVEEKTPLVAPDTEPRIIAKFPSRTVEGKVYSVKAVEDEITCDCPGFFYRNDCRHVQDVMRTLPFLKIKPRPEPEQKAPEYPEKAFNRNMQWVSEHYNSGKPVLHVSSVKSLTTDNTYQIYAIDNGQVACTCKSFFYRGNCRHADNYLARQKGTFLA